MSKSTATHVGHCQACGSLQKLPNGKLSLHGYKVTHGFFSGTCTGAKELPFELSCGLVARFVKSAQFHLDNLVAFQADLRKPATEPTCWESVGYNVANKRFGKEYRTELITLNAEYEAYTSGDGGSLKYSYLDTNGDVHGKDLSCRYSGLQRWDMPGATDRDILLATCTRQNRRHADHLEREAGQLRRYIAWQSERVASWQVAPLTPVSGPVKADKTAFDPEA